MYVKKIHTGLIVMVVASVFLISFIIGRATALGERHNMDKQEVYSPPVVTENEVSVETTVNIPKVPQEYGKKDEKKETKLPDRMLFPCGQAVLKDYSQTAVYSKTMGDWRSHTGIDFAADEGTDVASVWDGKAEKIYKDKLWGYCVEINHGDNLISKYKNLDKNIKIKEGDSIRSGQAIGKVGKSADIESLEESHLHFEIWKDGVSINPSSYVY